MKNKSAIIILTDPDGNFILQDRDDKPDIIDPDEIALFGGTIEEGETAEQAIARELMEELDAQIEPSKLEYFESFVSNDERSEIARDVSVFSYEGLEIDLGKLHEGKGVVIVKASEIETLPRIGRKALEILLSYNNKKLH